MRIGIILVLVFTLSLINISEAKPTKDTSQDLQKIASEPKAPELPDEVDIIKEVLKTQVIEDEIKPIEDGDEDIIGNTEEINNSYQPSVFVDFLESFSASINTKNVQAIKDFINFGEFFILDWNKKLIKTESEFIRLWEEISITEKFYDKRLNFSLHNIMPISQRFFAITSDFKIYENNNNIIEGTILFLLEVKDAENIVIKGVHISKKCIESYQSLALGKNIYTYIMFFLGVLIGAIFSKLFFKKQSTLDQ